MFSVKKIFLIFLPLAVVVGGVFYRQLPPEVAVVHPVRGQVIEAVYATGAVEADPIIRIATERAARLTSLMADEGAAVKKGQTLALLDDSELQASLQEMQIRQKNAENNYSRLSKLFPRGSVSKEQLDQANTDAKAAQAVTQQIQSQLSKLTILSPIDGEVIQRDGEIGEYLPVNQTLFYLRQANTPLRLTVDVDEEDIAKVKTGQTVLITADAFAGKVMEGKVRDITFRGDPVTRSYRVRVSLPVDNPLLIGMTAECNIIIAKRDHVVLVPNSAVSNQIIWLVRNGEAHKQDIKTGIRNADKTEITIGISEHDEIIVTPPEELKEGQKIRAVALKTADNAS